MRSSFLAVSLLLSAFVLSACAPTTPSATELAMNCENPGDNFQGIIGGRSLGAGNDLSSSTVLIKTLKSDDTILTCTGTILSQDSILTAAHCNSPFDKSTTIAFTNNSACAKTQAKHITRKVYKTSPHYNYLQGVKSLSSNSSYDLAVMKFSGGLPQGFKPRALPKPSFSHVAGESLVIAGYGWTDEKGRNAGDLKYKILPSSHIKKNLYIAIAQTTIQLEKTVIVEQYNGGVCSGDSGGPLYVRTEKGLVLIGTTSMGVDDRTIDEFSKRPCMGTALFTDIRPHLDWIYEKTYGY